MLENLWLRLAVVMSDPLGALRREEGQTLVEYALIIALVSVVLIAALKALAVAIGGVFTKIDSALNGA
jgi:Flp pilus assembly pilin Flp